MKRNRDLVLEDALRSSAKLFQKLAGASPEERKQIKWKLDLLSQLRDRRTLLSAEDRARVFLSYAGDELPFRRILTKLRATDWLEPVHAMASDGRFEVIDTITDRIRSCDLFVGILTPLYALDRKDDEGGDRAPGVWVLLEAGIALAFRIPVMFIFQDGIHKDYWQAGPTGAVRHVKFKNVEAMNGAIEQLIDRLRVCYGELVLTRRSAR